MKVLYVSTALSWRGGEQQLAYLYEELLGKGVEQLILCPTGSKLEKHCRDKNWNYRTGRKRSSLDFRFAGRIAKIAKEEKADIVNPHDSHAHTFTVLSSLVYGMKLPIVLHRKVDYAISSSPVSGFKYNFSQIKRIICISQEVKRVLRPRLRDPEKCVVINDGIDLERFQECKAGQLHSRFGIDESRKIVGNVSAITQQKDYFTFVKTAKLVLEQISDVHLLIAGDGDQAEEIQKMVTDLGLGDNFTFTGFLEDITTVLPCFDILLFTSEKEGLGTSILDAFAARVPVVATEAGGIPEIIRHDVNGFLGKVKDPESLARGVLKLLHQPETRQRYMENAWDVAKNHSKSVTADKTFSVFEDVLKADDLYS